MSDMAKNDVQGTVLDILKSIPKTPLKVAELTKRANAALGVTNVSDGAVRAACDNMVTNKIIEKMPFAPAAYCWTPASANAGATPSPMPVTAPAPPIPPVLVATARWVDMADGGKYRVRKIGSMDDIEALRKLREQNIPALLYGPPGTGKTTLARAAFPDLITLPGDGDTTVMDFTGDFVRRPENKDDDDAWEDGPLTVAMEEGLPFLIDDATVIPPKVMAVLYPVMDGRAMVSVKGRPPKLGREVHAKEGFYPIAAHNPGTVGAILSDALSSRFQMHIYTGTDLDMAREFDVPRKAIQIAANLVSKVEGEIITWCPQLRELLTYKRIAEVFGEKIAAANLAGSAPAHDRPEVLEVVRSVFGDSEIMPVAVS